jgi:hypothetical protein
MAESLRRRVSRAVRNQELTWRYVFNGKPTVAYKLDRPPLGTKERSIAAELSRKGIAFTTVADLLGSTTFFDEVVSSVQEAEERRKDEFLAARRAADDAGAIGQKTFLIELLGRRPVLDPASVFARFALEKPFVRIANAYFGMYTRLRYYNAWHNFRTRAEARESQLWHRDREDFLILKIFVYLSDIDDGAGPFTYVPGSHNKGSLRREPEFFVEGNVRRTTDEQMARVAPPASWVSGVGRAGTVVFADTRGYHKGGLARERDRVMFVSMFTSPASQSEELLERPGQIPLPADRELAFALAGRAERRFGIW